MTRVIHTGDTHVGYQQYHVPERREDFLAAFERVLEDAVADDVDAVVHAGDLFHDRRPTLSDVLGTVDALRTLDEAGIPFLAVVGNHEAKRDAQWLDLFESLDLATRLGDEPTVIGDTAFYGLDFVPRSRRDDLTYEFDPHDARFAALVTHGLFEPFDFGTWDAEALLGSATVAFDAVLLGDNHEHETCRIDDTWLTYCGSTERASAAERDDRGYNIVTFDDGVEITRRGLSTREFVYVDVELGPDAGLARVRERVAEYDVEGAVVIVHVDGEGDPFTPAGVEEFARERGALAVRVTDHRERTEEEGIEVSFADPDDAVRERIRELGLSEAARTIDEAVRASKVPDSKLDDEVQDRVAELVEDGDLAAFERGHDDGADETAAEDDGGRPSADEGADESSVEDEVDQGQESPEDPVESAEALVESDGGTSTEDDAVADADDQADEQDQASVGDFV